MAEKKQLVLVVEATVDLGSHWRTILSDYLEKIIRKFCGNEAMESASSTVELALVQFSAHGSYTPFLVQRSGWARNVEYFLEWLSCMHFSGGGFCDVAIAEGLTEVLMMCPPPNGTETPSTEVVQRHCILVAASNPCPLPTVYWPPNMQSVSGLSDAETIAKLFSQSCVSLSVVCPKQLPKLKAIYNAGKRNPSATTPTIDVVQNPNYHILISEDFMEACVALSPSVSRGNIPLATVKVEPSIVFPMVSSQAVKTYSPTSRESISSNDNLQDMKPVFSNIQRPLCPAGSVNVSILNSLPQARLEAEQPKYVKIWEGKLDGKRHGQAVMITRLEAYRRHSSSAEPLAEDWPSVFLIDRLISLDYMNNIHYTRKCELFVFRALQQHGFLGQMLERRLCAVIRLPSQALLLSPDQKPFRLFGMLLPPDIMV